MNPDPATVPPTAPAARRASQIECYLFFDGRCEEAIEFYRQVLGAEIGMLMRFNESPEAPPAGEGGPDVPGNKILHAEMRIGDSRIMMSDGESKGRPQFQGFALSVTAADAAEAHHYFEGLAEGGSVVMPLARTFFSSCFGMVADRFGVSWMVGVFP